MRAVHLCLILAMSCGDDAPEEAPSGNEKCPRVAVDNLDGQWVRVSGSAGDTTHRFEVRRTSGGGYEATFIQGGFERLQATGIAHKSVVVFTEQLQGEKLKQYSRGKRMKRQLHIEPRLKSCSLRLSHVGLKKVGEKEVEQNLPGRDEYLPFPEGQPFSFHSCDGHLFLGKAALTSKAASWEMNSSGGPKRSHQLGKQIPVGVWTDAASDGDASCTYSMDLWFDDRPVKNQQALPAGKVNKGKRRWFVKEWSAPYSGNHHFLMERFRTCGGKRELIGVSCIDAVLHP
jgi:hypothetical protein